MPPRDRESHLFSIRSWSRKMHKNSKVRSLDEHSSPFRKMVQEEAVVVRNAVKRYGKEKLVLDGLNMTVPRGSIYGLLGPSGCGKTTLLSCIVGVRRFNSGEVWVLGGTPGSAGSGIPGPRVGYMPQEISLVGEFTVLGALYYFGRINGLENDEIVSRHKFLSELLQLPPGDRMVKNMSGGQQRRVSFAAALIHSPELLILDEPTVGLDPILRENIWDYLSRITQDEGITVLITTHYIEETKDADKIGLLRCGQLLAESSPQQLLERFQCTSLEEAFLKLSQSQETPTVKTHESKVEDTGSDVLRQDKHRQTKGETAAYTNSKCKVTRLKKFKALMGKNCVQFMRHYSSLAFAFIFPIIQISVFFVAIGKDLNDLTIAVVNDEAGNCDYGSNLGNVWHDEEALTCHFGNVSCIFLHNFYSFIDEQEYYTNLSDATDAVHDGKHVGVLYFSQNFSEALEARIEYFASAEDADILASQIEVYLDMGDGQIGLYVQKKLYDSFFDTFENIMRDCKFPTKFANLPVRFEEPIYGSMDSTYTSFVAPGYMLILVFFLATALSTALIITDRVEGVWDRSLVQGVTTVEILFSHILTQILLIMIHGTLTMIFSFLVWDLDCKGSIFFVFVLIFLSGCGGLMWGFFISIMCTNHTMAHYASTGTFFPIIVLGGCIWPLEGMPESLRVISYALPTTLPALSLRAVIEKDLPIYEVEIYSGILVLLAWIVILLILCLIGLKLKSA